MRHLWRSSVIRPTAAIFLAGLAVVALTAGPVLAAGTHKPDGWVRVEGYHTEGSNVPQQGAWKGKDVYNTTALNQKATYLFGGAPLQGDYIYFTVNIQNDGAASDRFKVHGTGSTFMGTTFLKYFHGTTNITSAVVAGTFTTPSLSPGSSYQITVRNYFTTALVTITSVGDPSKSDAVKANIKTFCGC